MIDLYFNFLWSIFIIITFLFLVSIIVFIKKKIPFQKYLFVFAKNAIDVGFIGIFVPMLLNIYNSYPENKILIFVAVLLTSLPTITNVLLYFLKYKKKIVSLKNISKRGYVVSCFYGCCLGILGILTTALM